MEMREFGGTGIRASVVGLGCNNFGIYQNATQAVAVVHKALDVGINFLDMAGEHGSGLEESLVPRLWRHSRGGCGVWGGSADLCPIPCSCCLGPGAAGHADGQDRPGCMQSLPA